MERFGWEKEAWKRLIKGVQYGKKKKRKKEKEKNAGKTEERKQNDNWWKKTTYIEKTLMSIKGEKIKFSEVCLHCSV